MISVIEQDLLLITLMLLINHPILCQFIFYQEIFHKNSQTIFFHIGNIYVTYSKCVSTLRQIDYF